jgi:antigen flippase
VGDLWRGIAAAGGARLYGLLAGMATLILTARVLGPEGRGEVAAALTWAALLATLGYLSLGQVALHSAAGDRDESWLGRHLGSLALVTAVVSLVGWVAAAVAYAVTDGALFGDLPGYVLAFGLAGLPLLVWEHYGSSLLMAVDRLRLYNRAQVLGRTAGILLAVVLVVVLDFGVYGALVAILVAQGVVAAAGARDLVHAAGGRVRPHRPTTRVLVRAGLKLHLNAVGTFLFTSASVLVVQYYRGAEETGYFQLALQLTAVALVVPQAATMVLYAEVARDGPDAAWKANRRVLLGMTGLMILLALVGAALAPWVVPIVVGPDFGPAVPVFQLLLLALVGQSFSTVLAPQWIGRGLFWQSSVASLATGIVSLAACFVLVPDHGMYGAAYALLGVYTLSIFGNGAFAVWVSRRSRVAQPHCAPLVKPGDPA